MISTLELTILRGLTHNETYTRKVLPYLKDVYFENTTGRTSFTIISEYFSQYNRCPVASEYAIAIESLTGLNDDEFRDIGSAAEQIYGGTDTPSLEFLTDETEKWCKERAVYLALLESISIHDGSSDN